MNLLDLLNFVFFFTMNKSRSPITFFTRNIVDNISKTRFSIVLPLQENKVLGGFNSKPLETIGYIKNQLEVGSLEIKKAQLFFGKEGSKLIVRRDWLYLLQSKIELAIEKEDKQSIKVFILNFNECENSQSQQIPKSSTIQRGI